MLDGPALSEKEAFERIVALLQTYRWDGSAALYRTAVVVEQRAPAFVLDGSTPAFLVWFVEANSRTGNRYEVHGHVSLAAAEEAGVAWLGEERRIDWQTLSGSALVIVMSALTQSAWR